MVEAIGHWPLCFVSLVKTEKIKDCPLFGIMFLHAQLITSGFIGHARGNAQEFIFPSSLRKLIMTFHSQPYFYVWLSLFMCSKEN